MLLYLECPCTSFPAVCTGLQRNLPLSATCNGLLLSLVGEVDMTAHLGVNLAIGLVVMIRQFRIVRKQRHHKFSREHLGISTSKFSKPNHQELLTDLKVVVRIDSSEESNY